MRRLLIGLALLTIVCITAVFIAARRQDDDPRGDTERGARGFPLRGSLADDNDAIDAAVAEWREKQEKEAEEEDDDDDAESRERQARRPDENDDVTVLWIGAVDDEDVAILESQGGMLAQVTRRQGSESWFVRSERVRTENDFSGNTPIGVGDAVVTPERRPWRFVGAGENAYENPRDGLFWSDSGWDTEGFIVPERPLGERVPIYVTGVGARVVRDEDYAAFAKAIEEGYGRATWLAASEAQRQIEDAGDTRIAREPPQLAVPWTGEVPGHAYAAAVFQGGEYAGRRSLAVGYGERPNANEDKQEGTIGLGTAPPDRGEHSPGTFAAGTYELFDEFPYLVLAAGGDVETAHALVGAQEVSRKGPIAVIDARRFDDGAETVFFGRTADGAVVAPLRQPGNP